MEPQCRYRKTFSPAEKCGFIAFAMAIPLCFISWYAAVIPFLLFLLLCLVAPFLPTVGFFLPIISGAQSGITGVALTFDDGPDPYSTPIILELLGKYRLKATFFVVGRRAARHPELIEQILDQGHTIGNHSWDHDYFLMLRSSAGIRENIRKTQKTLGHHGIIPHMFRPPMGITGARLGGVLLQEHLICVNYSCRALDRGNRNIDNLAAKILDGLQPGDIIMLHDLPPEGEIKANLWQKELHFLLKCLAEKHEVTSLERATGHPVMTRTSHIREGQVVS